MAELRRPNRRGGVYGTPTNGAMASIERARLAREEAAQAELDKAARAEAANARLVAPAARPKPAPVASKPVTSASVRARPQKPVQQASPKSAPQRKQRMALGNPELLDKRAMDSLFTRWQDVERSSYSPDYEGYSLPEWLARNRETFDVMSALKSDGQAGEIEDYLRVSRGFGDPIERRQVIEGHGNPRFGNKLRTEFYGVPQAAADEQIAMALLQESGFSPVRSGNATTPTGTDITAFAGKTPLSVDAQSRVGRADRRTGEAQLTLGVAQGAGHLDRLFEEMPDVSLLSLIGSSVDSHRGMSTDKLLDTKNAHWNPISGGSDFDNDYQKDLIISSNRTGYASPDRTMSIKGPYNRERPQGFKLIDLEMARQALLTKSVNQLREMGVTPQFYGQRGDSFKLQIPSNIQDQLVNRDIPLAQRALQRLSAPRYN